MGGEEGGGEARGEECVVTEVGTLTPKPESARTRPYTPWLERGGRGCASCPCLCRVESVYESSIEGVISLGSRECGVPVACS
jgi:hypothetical protein